MDPSKADNTANIIMNGNGSAIDKIINLMIFDPSRTEILVLWLFLIVLIVGVIWLLTVWSRDESNDIVASDLICTDGKISESKMARFGAFLVSTWAFVYLIISDRMTEWYFVGYMAAWVGNALASKYMSDKVVTNRGDDSSKETSDQDEEPEPEPESENTDPPPKKRNGRR